MTASAPPPASFESLGLNPQLLQAAADAGFTAPTSVQQGAVPAVLAGRNVVARAHTGSGKTAAFGLPLLQMLSDGSRAAGARGNHIRALILVPTRELAIQVEAELTGFSRRLAERTGVLAVYGGVSINPQMLALRGGMDVLVATPGRMLDLYRHNALQLAHTGVLVLDEADRMLSLGFADELAEVLTLLPKRRQTLLFSATFPPPLQGIVATLAEDAVMVDVSGLASSDQPQIEEHVYVVDAYRKAALLIALIKQRELSRVLVFVGARKTGDRLVAKLRRAGLSAAGFHGGKTQAERGQGLSAFHAGKLQVLVATDLAARGIHIEDLPAVVNFEPPRSPSDYLHRIGRTARAGKSGLALSLVCADEEAHFRVIEKRIKRRLPREQVQNFEPHGSRSLDS